MVHGEINTSFGNVHNQSLRGRQSYPGNPAVILISVSFRYETSLFLYREEKSTEFSGSKKIKKKSLQVQFHSKRTEVS